MRIENEPKLDFSDVLIRPKRSTLRSRCEVSLIRTYTTVNSKRTIDCIPIFAANMDSTGTFEMALELAKNKIITAIHKHYSLSKWEEFLTKEDNKYIIPYIAVSCGTDISQFREKTSHILTRFNISLLCIDVANGYSESLVEFVKEVRVLHPSTIIIAGNVVTGEMCEELILAGADIIKVGIGPGSVCTTRKLTGVGYPQLSAVIECADASHGLGGLVISDGGCVCPGDIAKAFGGGADFVMLGGLLAGCDESGGELITLSDGKKVKEFYGMSSEKAMTKYYSKVAEYRASEGKEVQVPYKGPVADIIREILGGLRSACTYVGAKSLKEISKRTTFIMVSKQLNNVFH